MGLKETHKKIGKIIYEEFRIQPYLKSKVLSQKEKKLLYLLRSQCHNSKYNFKKLNRNNLNCRFGCLEVENQTHTFTKCPYLFSDYLNKQKTPYENIFGTISEQELLMSSYILIEQTRLHKIKHLLPGRGGCQDPCKSINTLLDYAADIIST